MTQHITQEQATHIAAERMLYEELDKEQYQLALEKFASIIAAAEREACASLCLRPHGWLSQPQQMVVDEIKRAILARSNAEVSGLSTRLPC